MKQAFYIFLIVFCSWRVQGVSGFVFYNLSVSNGLSYNEANNMCVDRKGNLWISTGRGLNMFNGQRVTRYFAEQYPQFQNNNIQSVTCDSNDHIWLLNEGGNVSMLDQRRSPHRLGLYDGSEFVKTTHIMVTKRGGVVLKTSKGLFRYPYSLKPGKQDSISLKQLIALQPGDLDSSKLKQIKQVLYFDEDRYLLKIDHSVYLVNLFTNTIDYVAPDQDCKALCKWNEDEALVYDLKEKCLKVIQFKTGNCLYPFERLRDQYDRELKATFNGALRLNLSEYLLLTSGDGIFIFDRVQGKIKHYGSDAANPTSLAKNRQTNAVIGPNGWVFINCRPNGISYFNNNDIIGNQYNFHDKKGNGYMGNISSLSTTDNNAFFVGYPEGLIYWKRDINESTFLDYPDGKGGWLIRKREVKSSAIDQKGRVWLGTVDNGIVVIDKNLRFLKHIPSDTVKVDCIPITSLSQVILSPSGEIWVSGYSGVCKIDPETYKVTNMKGKPIRSGNRRYYPMMFRGKDDLYVGINHVGVYHYNLATGAVDTFTKKKGLRNLTFYAFNFDREGTFYVGTAGGVTLFFKNGKSRTYTQKDGLLINGAEGLLYDQSNRMWIGNDVGLACYNVKDSSLKAYDERYGLSIFGFLIGVYNQLSNGEFMFGTPRGLQYFHPDSLVNKQLQLNVSITRIESRDIQTNVNGTETFKLRPSDNHVTFRFSSVEYFPHVRTFYEYKLEGIDKDWVRITDESSVTYNTLPPGDYIFEVKVSNDAKHWQVSDNKIMLCIESPFYKTWWFIMLAILAALLLLYYLYKEFKKRQQERERNLETELVITYFASQINSHKNEEELLWDIAKNCISKLNFADCVIYLLDEKRQVLVQKAAYGPKNPVDILIHQPIEIPLGKGICGEVALKGEAEIVDDTSKDPRYIVDDERRFSEISIPIKIDQNVFGVIDSEHPQKRFFTIQHQQILSTIAFLCANQLMKIRAEEENQRTAMELIENRQKATESRLQSLRLQMNPHFLFNALNSIQQMILAKEDLVATSYLSRFSKLLRAILVSSDKEMSSLKEEIEILRMYIELESVRFKDAFEYSIHFDEELEIEEIKIPTMLIQPFVENAIWHGLMHKDGERKLELRFLEKGNYLQCVVKDNGVGRSAANEWKTVAGREKKHVSKGIAVAEERLRTLNDSSGKQGSVEIIDLFENGLPAGTKVIINFPI